MKQRRYIIWGAHIYKDNRAVLHYQLGVRRLQVAERLVRRAPRAMLVTSDGSGDTSALATLLLAQMIPTLTAADSATVRSRSSGASLPTPRPSTASPISAAESLMTSVLEQPDQG